MFENFDVWAVVGAAVVALSGLLAGGVAWGVKKVERIVEASETKLDDKVWAAAKDGLREALDELEAEAEAEADAEAEQPVE